MGPLLPLALLLLQGASAERIVWRGDLESALAKAKAEKLPILIAFNMDGEGANDTMVSEVYRDAKVVGRSRKFLCLVASKFDHDPVKEGDRSVCSRFGSVTCAAKPFHNAPIASLPFTITAPGGNTVASSV